jgi:LPS-assembly protein
VTVEASKAQGLCGATETAVAMAARSARWAVCRLVPMLLAFGLILPTAADLAAQDPSITTGPVGSSRTFRNAPGGMFGVAPKIDSKLPLYLQGDELTYDTKGNKVVASGNVEILYNNFSLKADRVEYDRLAGTLVAQGNVEVKDPNGNVTRAQFWRATEDFRDAFAESLSVTTKDQSRISARRVIRRDGNVSEFEDGKFTPCKSDAGKSPLWCISAARIIHDQTAATITYQDAKFEIFGVPVLYMPYFQHADPSVKRRSGFLSPQFGNSTNLGFTFEVPYYFALSPNYDFTFSPEYMSKQGMLYKGEWRHKLANGQYSVKFGALEQDADKLNCESKATADLRAACRRLDGWRGTIETRGEFSLGSWWKYGWNVTLESDDTFRRFYGFDDILQTDRVNNGYLVGISDRNYFGANLYHFGGLQFTDTDSASSRVHPVIDYNYIAGAPLLGGELAFNGHARAMTRVTGSAAAAAGFAGTDSTHVVAEVTWRRKFIDAIGQTFTPFFSGRGDAYTFSDARTFDSATGLATAAPAYSDSIFRATGTAALTYSYPWVAHTGTSSHVIEPTAQIVSRASNKIDQRRLPNEDAKSLVFDDGLLFDVNKTSGFDRVEEGTRANLGLQYSFQSSSGFHARAVFGQSFHLGGNNIFTDPGRNVAYVPGTVAVSPFNYTPFNGLETARSDYVAGLYLSPLKNLSLVTQSRFDEHDWTLRRHDTLLSYYYGPLTGQILYTQAFVDPSLRVGTLVPGTEAAHQRDIIASVGLKLTDNWSILGQIRYDVDSRFRLQDLVQLRYADECFVLSATYSENFIEDPARDLKPDRTVMLRFELKHLGEFGTKSDNLGFGNRVN